MGDELPTFDTAQEAWSYLCDERERDEENGDDEDNYSITRELGRSTMVGQVMSANVRDADKPVTHTCQQCGLVFTLPADVTLTRGSRPCGWSH